MATGASKAKRDYKKKSAAAYFDALQKVERADPLKRIDTQSARKLDDQLDGNLSYGTKRIAMKADKLGRTINADKSLNKDIEAYNKRFDEVERQKNGETITKYDVVKNPMGGNGMASYGEQKLNTESAIGKFDTLDEAKSKTAPTNIKSYVGFGQTQDTTPTGFGQTQEQTYRVDEAKLTPISRNYRQLSGTQGAYEDLEKLSKNVGANPTSALTKDYEALGNQLRSKLKRDVGNTSAKPVGLLGTELASAAPVQEVIT
jgi:hypothetical protein